MSSQPQKRIPRPSGSTGRANGKQRAVPQNGKFENPVLRQLSSKRERFPIELLPGILSSCQSSLESPQPAFQSIAHPGVTRCLRFIGRNPRFKLRDLANVSGLSRRGLHKAFRTHVGCSPGSVVVMVRLWSACELLANSSLPVGKIAARCGYRNSNSLYVAIQRFLGTTPRHIRVQSPDYGRMDLARQRRNQKLPLLRPMEERDGKRRHSCPVSPHAEFIAACERSEPLQCREE